MNIIIYILIMVVLSFQRVYAKNTVVLDVASDLKFSWKLRGDYVYVSTGSLIEEVSQHLPQNFSFASIANARGVWAIFPSLSPVSTKNNISKWTNKVSFSFAASAQLLDSVTVRHNSGGHPIINIIGTYGNFSDTPQSMYKYWADFTYSLHGSSRFTIEAIANEERDYILIDRIEAIFVETTTTPRPPRPTKITTTPLPKPKSGGLSLNHPMLTCLPLLFAIFVLLLI